MTGVSDDALAEAGETLTDTIDRWIDKLTAHATGSPAPGTPRWLRLWNARETGEGAAWWRQQLLARIAIADIAGVDPAPYIAQARAQGIDAAEIRIARNARAPHATRGATGSRRRRGSSADQLAIF
ncbi:hypothetical protein HT102_10290 [Hoyosella sp. G463]|uniref:Uncharacterized protein n=1 Tax=Lolliginicoccus lacisalsi TaxID=2742202 RepID=A0A927JEG3_9ACTN|nr:hypothetical protein [Lolliginicoccus lacisalsi]MBD8506877.1 hypothetical protein [Lolliginicoccus lacisalsi]